VSARAQAPAHRGQQAGEEKLPASTKAVVALGDHTLNLTLSALSLFYLYYLTEHAGLRPSLASMVLLVGRAVDALTDPAMGRISDHTRLRGGRRRPYFLIGAVPFGLSFAALWIDYPVESQLVKFCFYSSAYVLYCLASTVLAVPYVALLPELTLDYHERTSVNTYRAVGSVAGTLVAAAAIRPLSNVFGGGAAGFALTGVIAGIWIVWPWFAIYRTTRERPEFQRQTQLGILEGIHVLARHRSYRRLTAFYLCSRIAMDVVAAMFIFFFQYWLHRPSDFEITMISLLLTVVVTLPVWLRISRTRDKAQIFVLGASWWVLMQGALFFVTPEWPTWSIVALAAAAGVGYAVADMMPWSMLGDVIDEDELLTGERREGLYAGFFTFLRKLGGATAVFIAGSLLDLAGFAGGREQSDLAVLAIRGLTAGLPAVFLVAAVVLASRYPITRDVHRQIRLQISTRKQTP
jgi:sugar (glycoside-pentoside-hexuronide) transporter